jgi:hypothetical protein
MRTLPEGRSLGVLVAQLQVQEMPSGAKAMTLEDLTRLVNQTLAADPGTGPHDVARVVAAAVKRENAGECAIRAQDAREEGEYYASVALDTAARDMRVAADALAPRQEAKQ